eukprot:gnl/TRDRNA2_/TRDRNA2_182019_c0_seq1.p1 gnl/TRDRNA2_/TRDRNA2_182019_c0~~gnl/TRDRNA2_/TRDRNA2_182019_c0_seq1.p1  ORF type:complete len:407 (-),score=63.52 gnl/TRDRNA2_/TRDRNA2_182019_c0_seq1:74-1294(-)
MDLEAQPGSSRKFADMYTWLRTEKPSDLDDKSRGSMSFTHGHKTDVMTYQAKTLTSWQALGMFHGSVWDNSPLWISVVCTLVLAGIFAVFTYMVVPDPGALKAGKFLQVGTFLNVFVGVMLGFFLSSSVNRWYSCATGFLELFDAIRNMQMQCHALGVRPELENKLMRYGVLSVWLIHIELMVWAKPPPYRDAEKQRLWKQLYEERQGLVVQPERVTLMNVSEPSALIWTWVASLVGRMAQDGDIPGMATPTYGRILGLVQSAHGGIRSINESMFVQAPFIYTHMLATLVHLNNILNALSFGMLLGVTIGVINANEGPKGDGVSATSGQVARDLQNLTVGFFFMVVGPCLYQALLNVAILIAQPFNNEDGIIPTLTLLASLERDLKDGWKFAENPPSWEKAYFKKA